MRQAQANEARPAGIQLATVPVVAAQLAVSRSKVYQMMDRGELPYVKLGKNRRIPVDAVKSLVAANTVG